MAGKTRQDARAVVGSRANSAAPGVFDTMSQAGAECYLRARDLPRLVALWPHELLDQSPEGGLRASCRSSDARFVPSAAADVPAIRAMSSTATLVC